jgi:hypothetical protein
MQIKYIVNKNILTGRAGIRPLRQDIDDEVYYETIRMAKKYNLLQFEKNFWRLDSNKVPPSPGNRNLPQFSTSDTCQELQNNEPVEHYFGLYFF